MNIPTMNPEQAVTSLSALAQSSRLKIFRLLVVAGDQGCTVGDIGKQLALPSATLSFHLKELAHSGLIEKKQQGRFVNYVANYTQMKFLIAFLSEQCCEGVEQEDCVIDIEICN
ncbi:ArsR/SmtB family transcription factor [Acinetobacter johnsonii]|jgi:predicted transcriptional regulator